MLPRDRIEGPIYRDDTVSCCWHLTSRSKHDKIWPHSLCHAKSHLTDPPRDVRTDPLSSCPAVTILQALVKSPWGAGPLQSLVPALDRKVGQGAMTPMKLVVVCSLGQPLIAHYYCDVSGPVTLKVRRPTTPSPKIMSSADSSALRGQGYRFRICS